MSNATFDLLHLRAGNGAVRDDRFVLFGDGARRELRCGGETMEPPSDPFALARLKLHFHKLRLQNLTTAFEELRQAVTAKANARTTDPSDAEDVRRLIELERRFRKAKVQFAGAQREFDGLAVAVGDAGPGHI